MPIIRQIPEIHKKGQYRNSVIIPQGSIAWRQGEPFGKEQIKFIPPPPYPRKVISLLNKRPVGWIEKGRTPQETLQVIGNKTRLPKTISLDMGVEYIYIDTSKMTIAFTNRERRDVTTPSFVTSELDVPAQPITRLIEQRRMMAETGGVRSTKKSRHHVKRTYNEQISSVRRY